VKTNEAKGFFLGIFGDPKVWLFTALAVGAAVYISRLGPFQRISAVVSDEISRAIGATSNGPIVLVRLERDFSKPQLQRLLAHAIPALMDNYGATALGVDIDFSGAGYDDLAKSFSNWSSRDGNASNVVWATRYERGSQRLARSVPVEACKDCSSANCRSRFQPLPVFASGYEPPNYGMAYAWTDIGGTTRSSFRFVCQLDTTAPLKTFHFQLVETYCGRNPSQYECERLEPNHQSTTALHTWYEAKVMDLCDLVTCDGADLGKPPSNPSNQLSNKLAILYADVDGNDEHATLGGTRKGAEVVASLAMNEMLYGASDQSSAEWVKLALEGFVTLLLILLFGWKVTEHWAVMLAGLLFVLYLYTVRRLSVAIPDFRDYALGLLLAFAIEVWMKAAFHSLWGSSKSEDCSGEESMAAAKLAPDQER
jgi:hypothetical protein